MANVDDPIPISTGDGNVLVCRYFLLRVRHPDLGFWELFSKFLISAFDLVVHSLHGLFWLLPALAPLWFFLIFNTISHIILCA